MKSYKLENINQKMFDKCGLLMTDLVGVHGMDPHLPAHLPLHLPSARVCRTAILCKTAQAPTITQTFSGPILISACKT